MCRERLNSLMAGTQPVDSQPWEAFEYPEAPRDARFSGGASAQGSMDWEQRLANVFPAIRGGGGDAWDLGQGPNESYGREGNVPSGDGADAKANGQAEKGQPDPPRDPVLEAEDWQRRLAAECHSAEERGRQHGIELGLAQGRAEAGRQLEGERQRLLSQAANLVASFSETCNHYLHRLEQESVRLALAIAARVLRRESQMDPLLLTGAVRVALGQLAESTAVRLRVPSRDEEMWKEAMALMPGLPQRPEVVGDSAMAAGDCRLETELGLADLSLWAQLKEIERGFFDRHGVERGGQKTRSENASGMDS
jgi:flagellar assembly protein FliH